MDFPGYPAESDESDESELRMIEVEERAQGPAVKDPEALFANIRRHYAERRRYQLPPARTLAGFRRFRRVSQEGLARLLGIKQSRVSRFEHHPNPRLDALREYVSALGGTLFVMVRLPDRDVQLTLDGGPGVVGGLSAPSARLAPPPGSSERPD